MNNGNNGFDQRNGYNNYNQPNGYSPYNNQNGNYGGYQQQGYQQNFQQQGYQQNFQQQGYQQGYQQQDYQQGYQQQGVSTYTQDYQQTGSRISMAEYSKRIYGWLSAGLGITFLIGFVLMNIFTRDPVALLNFLPVIYGGLIVEVILVIVLGFFIRKLPYVASLSLFMIYSVVNGLTLTPLMVVYGAQDVIFAFAATAALFIGISIYGIVTKRDLTKLGPILLIGLIVLIGYSLIAMIFRMPTDSLIISLIGIALFTGFTAYDTHKIKKGYQYYQHDEELLKKSTVNVALELYLDFINLFIYILRLLGAARR